VTFVGKSSSRPGSESWHHSVSARPPAEETSEDGECSEDFFKIMLAFLASLTFVLLTGLLLANGAFCLTSQDVPAAELPTSNASPEIGSSPTPRSEPSPGVSAVLPTDNHTSPADQPGAAFQNDTSDENSISNDTGSGDLQNEQGTGTPGYQAGAETTPPPPALDAGVMAVGPELGSQSLDPEITKAIVPALAASLRITESARKRLINGQVDDAMRDLARAVSLDPSDAFAYYYLGRAYLARNNYTQALTFFRRAEIGFSGRPDWTAEALSYEGICDEELGKIAEAAEAYRRALADSPNNFRARVGNGRLASVPGPLENVDAPPPSQDLDIPPPSAPDESAPLEQPPPPPPE
jgi:TolA-binding protein